MIQPGDRFGQVTVISHPDSGRPRRVEVRCDCGVVKAMRADYVRQAKSCGCLTALARLSANTTHGKSGTLAHKSWTSMIYRCENPTHKSYPNYGGRGITVCERWRSFENFFADMGERPAGMALDRIDNSKGYSPENCKWVTPKDNANNRRSSRVIEAFGERLTLKQWATRFGIGPQTISKRLAAGWGPETSVSAQGTLRGNLRFELLTGRR